MPGSRSLETIEKAGQRKKGRRRESRKKKKKTGGRRHAVFRSRAHLAQGPTLEVLNRLSRLVKSYEPSGPLLLEIIPVSVAGIGATRSIATPPGWDVSPSQVTSQHFVRLP